MKKYGYNEDSLKKEYDMIKKVIELNKKQKSNTGEAQRATGKKDKAVDTIDEWMSEYIKVARIVFEEDEQTLEKLGIFVRNSGSAPKKKEKEEVKK
jgi:hypothetical protein